MSQKRKLPFDRKDGNVIIHTREGKDKTITWDEFVRLVKTPEYQDNKYRLIPEEEFEQWYKRMKMPAQVRDYHASMKREETSRKKVSN
jgi:hypothetical protein